MQRSLLPLLVLLLLSAAAAATAKQVQSSSPLYALTCQPIADEARARIQALTLRAEREYKADVEACAGGQEPCLKRARMYAAQRVRQIELVQAREQRQLRECESSPGNGKAPSRSLTKAVAEYNAHRDQCAGNPDCLVQARLLAARRARQIQSTAANDEERYVSARTRRPSRQAYYGTAHAFAAD